MLKNPLYHYGSPDLQLPVNLNFREFILNKFIEYKDKTIINGLTEEKITYGEIAQRSMNLAISLTRLGLRKGQTVAICSENRTEFWSAVVGSICTGATFSALNMMYTKHEMSHVVSIAKQNYIICSPIAYKMHAETFKSLKFIEKIIIFGDDIPAGTISFNDLVAAQTVRYEEFRAADDNGPDDPLFILYSSGTTSLPKGVILTHRSILISACYIFPCLAVINLACIAVADLIGKRWSRISSTKSLTLINEKTQTSVTYSRIAQEAVNLAVSLARLGVRQGQAVAICSESRLEVWTAVAGVVCAGAIMTPLNMGYTAGELTHVLNISKPTHVIASPSCYKTHEKTFRSQKFIKKIIVFGANPPNTVSFNDLIEENVNIESFEVPEVKGQTDTLFILYSSGTTGLPKGVMITHLNAITTVLLPQVKEDLPGNAAVVSVTPWFHAIGLMLCLTNLVSGLKTITLERFELNSYMKTIEKYKITRLTVVPPMLVALAKSDAPYDLSCVEYFTCGAAPLAADIMLAVKTRFSGLKAVLQAYGMTESTVAIAKEYSDGRTAKPGSVGPVVSGSVVKILELDTRKPLGPRQQGEICVKGVTIMKGYVGRDRREDFDEEGFFKTGDIGYYDEDGYLYIVDRLKELIKYKGHQVPPAEIESILLQHEAVRDVGVVGLSHKTAGEVPLAFVVTQPGRSASETVLQAFVAERLSKPKHLRGGVRFVKEIPKNPSGKILRRLLRTIANKETSKL